MNPNQVSLLLCCMLVTFVTGSIHSFSVFLVPFEELLGLSRADVSLFYSFALVFLTISVLFGYLVYDRLRPAVLVAVACLGAGGGLLLSAHGNSWGQVFLGYSVLFGLANGVAYGYVLQLSGLALPDHKGFAMAAVTAAYAVGSVVFSFVLGALVQVLSLGTALIILGAVITFSGVVSALVLVRLGTTWDQSDTTADSVPAMPPSRNVVLLWLAYGCSVFAGLMAIGHAAGIIQTLGGDYGLGVWGAVCIGIGSSVGGFFIGAVISRRNMDAWLLALPVVSAAALLGLGLVDWPGPAIALLSVIGFAYGAIIAVYPYAISEYFGELGPKIYGRVFTAWGFAGLAGPWTAGRLYDASGNYGTALATASVIALVSTAVYLKARRAVSAR